jgi:hypothetical protein
LGKNGKIKNNENTNLSYSFIIDVSENSDKLGVINLFENKEKQKAREIVHLFQRQLDHLPEIFPKSRGSFETLNYLNL